MDLSLYRAAGKLIVNAGALETLTYLWIGELTEPGETRQQTCALAFGERVDAIVTLLNSYDIPEEIREPAARRWTEALQLGEIRDAVARNPVVFGWRSPQTGEPDFIRIPLVIGNLRDSPEESTPSLDLKALNTAIDSIVDVARHLEDLLTKLPTRLE